MAVRANPKMIDDLEHFGARDVVKCYQCGNCSAACTHSKDAHVFPRKSMRYLQMGLEKPLRSTLDPWLCYYCGECSDQCPRGAEPGETMMGIRRWLTAQYDFTGLSGLLYRSFASELVAVVILALLTGVGFLTFGFLGGGGNLSVYDGPGAFLPAHDIHLFDWSMGAVLGGLLGINCLRMWLFTMRNEHSVPVPLSLYIRHAFLLPVHFFTQKSFRDCERKRPWAMHLVLMLSYVTMLALIMLFLKYMQAGPQVNWYAHTFGYLSALGLVTTGILAVVGRFKKDEAYHRHSHESDWMFLALLLFVSITGIIQHVLHRVGLPMAANITYVVHLMGVVPMLGLEVPFSKWSHLAYRPLAIYFAQLQEAAQAEGAVPLGATTKPQSAA
jgi:quinone-modifying oxidoreductase, subunit QmoC